MAVLESGTLAPRFALNDVETEAKRPPGFDNWTLLVFYKTTCPTCKLALPYLDAFAAYQEGGLQTLAIAEDAPADIEGFRANYGRRLPTVTEPPPYDVSAAYGLTNVPSVFLVEPGGRIADTVVGFSKTAYSALSEKAASVVSLPPVELFHPGDDVPDWKPG